MYTMCKTTKYKIGDKIRVIRGSIICDKYMNLNRPIIAKAGDMIIYDFTPETIGEKGIIVGAHKTQNIDNYAIEGTTKHAWFNNNEIELDNE